MWGAEVLLASHMLSNVCTASRACCRCWRPCASSKAAQMRRWLRCVHRLRCGARAWPARPAAAWRRRATRTCQTQSPLAAAAAGCCSQGQGWGLGPAPTRAHPLRSLTVARGAAGHMTQGQGQRAWPQGPAHSEAAALPSSRAAVQREGAEASRMALTKERSQETAIAGRRPAMTTLASCPLTSSALRPPSCCWSSTATRTLPRMCAMFPILLEA